MRNLVEKRSHELLAVIVGFQDHCIDDVILAAQALVSVFKSGGKLLICGNGGSAADSQHFAAEFINAYSRTINRRALPAIALSTDSSVITSIANDFGFETIFSRQVEALGNKDDVLLVLTTSGSSLNCIKAIESAKKIGMKTISLTSIGGEVAKISDLSIKVPSKNTQEIQACHLHAYHLLTEIVESELFGGK